MDRTEQLIIGLNAVIETHAMVLFDALHQKGLLNYADMQDAIGRIRDDLNPAAAIPPVLNALNRAEQMYQPGPLPPVHAQPGDPQP
jgi:hypothetical protein